MWFFFSDDPIKPFSIDSIFYRRNIPTSNKKNYIGKFKYFFPKIVCQNLKWLMLYVLAFNCLAPFIKILYKTITSTINTSFHQRDWLILFSFVNFQHCKEDIRLKQITPSAWIFIK